MLETIWNAFQSQLPLALLVVFMLLFSALSRLCPCNDDHPIWNKESFITDISYYLLMPIANRFVHLFFFGLGIFVIFQGKSLDELGDYAVNGFGPARELPIWAQAAIVFILMDIVLYWLHRWFHTGKMWKYHAIHHSSEQVHWHSTYRFHPINTWLSFVLTDVLMMLMGFSPAAIACMATFNAFYSAMVHANLNWTFGPFKYVFASPVFHRWHHTTEKEGLDKNFAPTFPLLDVIFGTFYMPEGKRPTQYGVSGSKIPTGFLEQLVWPFKQPKRQKPLAAPQKTAR